MPTRAFHHDGRLARSWGAEDRAASIDTYTLGYVETLDLEDVDPVFAASVDPAEADIADTDIEDVVYTIESAECAGG